MNRTRRRRTIAGVILLLAAAILIIWNPANYQPLEPPPNPDVLTDSGSASAALDRLPIKGRAPKTGYERALFGDRWTLHNGCDTRNRILLRDLTNTVIDDQCRVISGQLNDPYTGKTILFKRGAESSADVQIDHVVALADAWQKGAQQLSFSRRMMFANDPLGLLAVDGDANEQKSDSDAATWLPPNKPFRCQYIARQIAVKQKYQLWVTPAEHRAMGRVLSSCPGQNLPVAGLDIAI